MSMSSPRWWSTLISIVKNNPKANVFQLATIDDNNSPQARSHIHRGFLQSDHLLLTTTDIRTPKVEQILKNPTVHVVWWIESTEDQFRISGNASVVPAPSHALHSKFDPTKGLALAENGIDYWQNMRKEVFNNMSSHMRASWCRPPPGSVMPGGYEEAKKWPTSVPKLGEASSDEEKKNQEWAFGNFALVVIKPLSVDWVQLGIVPNQRTKFTRIGEKWHEEIVVP